MDSRYCDQCGGYRDATWNRQEQRRMAAGDSLPAAAPFSEWRKETPAREPSVAGDLLVPAGQALVSGIVVALGAAVYCAVAGWPWIYAAFAGTLAFAASWFLLLADDRRLLRNIEHVIGRDIDGDGHVGKPEPEPQVHRIEVTERSGSKGNRMAYIDLPDGVTADTMRGVATAVLAPAGTFSRPYLCRERNILTQTQYNELRQRWLDAGLLAALPGNRTDVTAAGRVVLKHFKDGGNDGE